MEGDTRNFKSGEGMDDDIQYRNQKLKKGVFQFQEQPSSDVLQLITSHTTWTYEVIDKKHDVAKSNKPVNELPKDADDDEDPKDPPTSSGNVTQHKSTSVSTNSRNSSTNNVESLKSYFKTNQSVMFLLQLTLISHLHFQGIPMETFSNTEWSQFYRSYTAFNNQNMIDPAKFKFKSAALMETGSVRPG